MVVWLIVTNTTFVNGGKNGEDRCTWRWRIGAHCRAPSQTPCGKETHSSCCHTQLALELDPVNIWVGTGDMPKSKVVFPLAKIYQKQKIEFTQARATELHPDGAGEDSRPYVVVEHTSAQRRGESEKYITTTSLMRPGQSSISRPPKVWDQKRATPFQCVLPTMQIMQLKNWQKSSIKCAPDSAKRS